MKAALTVFLLSGMALAQSKDEKVDILFTKLEATATEIARQFDGVMGFAILDFAGKEAPPPLPAMRNI